MSDSFPAHTWHMPRHEWPKVEEVVRWFWGLECAGHIETPVPWSSNLEWIAAFFGRTCE